MAKLRVVQQGLQSSKGRLIFFICCTFTLFICSSTGAFYLPDTGQSKCYQRDCVWPPVEIPCSGTLQDGAYSINPMSFTDNSNGTVTDNNTGLMWQKEDDGNWYFGDQASDVCGSLNLGGKGDWRGPPKTESRSIG